MAKNNAAALPAWRCLYLCNLVNLWIKFLIFNLNFYDQVSISAQKMGHK